MTFDAGTCLISYIGGCFDGAFQIASRDQVEAVPLFTIHHWRGNRAIIYRARETYTGQPRLAVHYAGTVPIAESEGDAPPPICLSTVPDFPPPQPSILVRFHGGPLDAEMQLIPRTELAGAVGQFPFCRLPMPCGNVIYYRADCLYDGMTNTLDVLLSDVEVHDCGDGP